jgi:hypothetical protein
VCWCVPFFSREGVYVLRCLSFAIRIPSERYILGCVTEGQGNRSNYRTRLIAFHTILLSPCSVPYLRRIFALFMRPAHQVRP